MASTDPSLPSKPMIWVSMHPAYRDMSRRDLHRALMNRATQLKAGGVRSQADRQQMVEDTWKLLFAAAYTIDPRPPGGSRPEDTLQPTSPTFSEDFVRAFNNLNADEVVAVRWATMGRALHFLRRSWHVLDTKGTDGMELRQKALGSAAGFREVLRYIAEHRSRGV